MNKKLTLAAILSTTALFAGCGDSDDTPTGPSHPTSGDIEFGIQLKATTTPKTTATASGEKASESGDVSQFFDTLDEKGAVYGPRPEALAMVDEFCALMDADTSSNTFYTIVETMGDKKFTNYDAAVFLGETIRLFCPAHYEAARQYVPIF
ncbi:DUF732 domain-containing protein (plasmid) [Rhodococcus aetherivorans]|uniref:DUF732 domain-containing protein n=1 Tax=Rhodococcus aetherivorans TaxID=191292 RepID=UPI0002D2464C|nr:DUF732 domain-containing protein [Rhodococcus aetherivorans]CCW15589.1 hypothetical protein EBESD8_61660 [Rhodococcus aetherivorans]